MKSYKTIGVAVVVATLAFVMSLLVPVQVTEVANAEVYITNAVTPHLSPLQVIWLARLMNCESGINEVAINPNDLDNTPSWGILQFKPETLTTFAVKYGLKNELMNAETQVSIVTYWILHPGEIVWEGQFPDCVRKYGLPPIQ